MKNKNLEETTEYVLVFKDTYNALLAEYKAKGMDKRTASYNATVNEYKATIKEYQVLIKQLKKQTNKEESIEVIRKYRNKIKECQNLIKECRKEQMADFIEMIDIEGSLFRNYKESLIQVIKIKMMSGKKFDCGSKTEKTAEKDKTSESTNFSCNRAMVESLRVSGEYQYNRYTSDNGTSKFKGKSGTIAKDNNEDVNVFNENDEDTIIEENCTEVNDNVTVYEIDDVLTCLTTKILVKELSEQYFIYKEDAAWAFRSICHVIHNELCDMVKKLPGDIPIESKNSKKTTAPNNNSSNCNTEKPACYKTVYLDSTITDDEGNTTTIGSMTADPSQDTEKNVIRQELVSYAKNTFVHAVIRKLIPKPKYLLAYLNAVAGRTGHELCYDIISEGFSSSLSFVIKLLKDKDINVDYLNNIEFEWKDNISAIKKNNNIVNNWADESRKIAQEMCVKMNIY